MSDRSQRWLGRLEEFLSMQRTLVVSALALALTSCLAATKHSCEEDNTCGAAAETGGSAGAATGGEGGGAGVTTGGGVGGASGTGAGGASPTGGAGGSPAGGETGSGATSGGGATGGSTSDGGRGDQGGRGNASEGGQGGQGGAPPTCVDVDPTASPADDSCVISEEFGIFVSPAGDDASGQGTREQPFATLTYAIAEAAARDRHVYACATSGAFAETLVLDSAADDVKLFGGFDCVEWKYDPSRQTRIHGGTTAVTVVDTQGLALTDFNILSANASDPGDSSVALFATGADVTLERVTLTARDAANGEDGTLSPFTYPDVDTDLAGCDAADDTGECATSGRCTFTCPTADTTRGGSRGGTGQDGGYGTPLGSDNSGILTTECGNGTKGDDGSDGSDGPGATTLGTLTATGWSPADGTDGAPGGVGQGGGGGSGGFNAGEGGGGGCGGCGGNGARAGQGGGASIALLSFRSSISLVDSTLVAGDAGHGGDAAAGQLGQSNPLQASVAGFGGLQIAPGCPGGNGGVGGNGGAAGGGAGGLSTGILYAGSAPAVDSATYDAITIGTPGSGGAALSGLQETAGTDGVAEPVAPAP